jgi:hypothetical protein
VLAFGASAAGLSQAVGEPQCLGFVPQQLEWKGTSLTRRRIVSSRRVALLRLFRFLPARDEQQLLAKEIFS